MPTTTEVHGPNGDKARNGWYDFINGGDYPPDVQDRLVDALLLAETNEFNSRLPDGWSWYPSTSMIIMPIDDSDGDTEEIDLDVLQREACEAVTARYEEVEAAVLAEVDTDRSGDPSTRASE